MPSATVSVREPTHAQRSLPYRNEKKLYSVHVARYNTFAMSVEQVSLSRSRQMASDRQRTTEYSGNNSQCRFLAQGKTLHRTVW